METHSLPQLKGFSPQRPRVNMLHNSEQMRVVLFGFLPGQEMSPHSVASEISFYILEGEGRVLVGEEESPVSAGALVFCPPGARHGIKTTTNMVVLATISPSPG